MGVTIRCDEATTITRCDDCPNSVMPGQALVVAESGTTRKAWCPACGMPRYVASYYTGVVRID